MLAARCYHCSVNSAQAGTKLLCLFVCRSSSAAKSLAMSMPAAAASLSAAASEPGPAPGPQPPLLGNPLLTPQPALLPALQPGPMAGLPASKRCKQQHHQRQLQTECWQVLIFQALLSVCMLLCVSYVCCVMECVHKALLQTSGSDATLQAIAVIRAHEEWLSSGAWLLLSRLGSRATLLGKARAPPALSGTSMASIVSRLRCALAIKP